MISSLIKAGRKPGRRTLAVCLVMATPCFVPVLWAEPGPPAFNGLDNELTPEQQQAMGLDQLSPAQREALEAWLQTRLGGTVSQGAVSQDVAHLPVAAPSSDLGNDLPATATATATAPADTVSSVPEPAAAERAAFEAEVERRVAAEVAAARAADKAVEDNAPFEASLDASFTGWFGKTVFRLDNGQVWKQRSATSYRHESDDRRVRFRQNFFGGWEMEVISSGRTVTVRRLR